VTKTIIATLGYLALSINVYGQGGDVEQQIKQLQQEATKSQMNNDVLWAQQHLADGFIAGHRQWQTKDEFIKDLQNKSNKWKSGNISDVHVATFGSNRGGALQVHLRRRHRWHAPRAHGHLQRHLGE
jgi:hypothetical protein